MAEGQKSGRSATGVNVAGIGDASMLRRRAERCFRLAKSIASRIDAETVELFGRDYIEMADEARQAQNIPNAAA